MSGEPVNLKEVQSWMLRVVSHPGGAAAGLQAVGEEGLFPGGATVPEQVVPGNDRLSPAQQLQIYAFMYFARLVEVLEMEFPTVRFLLGQEHFEKLARTFLTIHPSSHYSLNRLSVGFPDFLRNEARDVPHQDFAVALAQVERAMEDVTDDPRDEPLSSDALSSIPRERWPSARLRPIRAMRLLELSHPTTEFMNAVQQDRHENVPPAGPTVICVYRPDSTVYRKPIPPLRHQLLARLVAGEPLGQAIEGIVRDGEVDPASLAGSLAGWFEDWAEDRLFCAIEFDDA